MGQRVRCFMLERTDQFQRVLRRFTYNSQGVCPGQQNWGHDATALLDVITAETDLEGVIVATPHDDPRWPSTCARCDYAFTPGDEWQANAHRLYRMPDGSLTRPENAPAGAMRFVPWYDSIFVPQLEHVLVVQLPNGCEWIVDSQANNCTIPDDRRQERHHCWTIEGTLPDITAGKGQPTCSAGAGSILAGSYHGFLRSGYLEEC